MVLLAIVIAVGLWRLNHIQWWRAGVFAVASQSVATLLFSAGGTVENPAGDGLITIWVRNWSNDGPEVLALLPFALGLGWAIPIWLLFSAIKAIKREHQSSGAQ